MTDSIADSVRAMRETYSTAEVSHDGKPSAWLIDAADLLAQPDPGPTPFLVEDLIVDQAIVAAVGKWKTTKSYALLDLCIAVAAGRAAFGKFTVPNPGPVVFINEESGLRALWRRLDALCRGRAIDPEELRGRLHVAANAGVKLDDLGWQTDLLAMGIDLRPRLIVVDPLARAKSAIREENSQSDMAVVVEFVRALREATGAAVAFVHHTGHTGTQMRGSSDLESVWETRLTWKRDGQDPVVTIASEHREAEASGEIRYRINWDSLTRTMRFDVVEDELRERVLEYRRDHPEASANEVHKHVGGRKQTVLEIVKELNDEGGSQPGNHPGTTPLWGGVVPAPLKEGGREPPAPGSQPGNHPLGEPGYALHVDGAFAAGHVTEPELRELLRLDALVARAGNGAP